jgi:hypothetical protein
MEAPPAASSLRQVIENVVRMFESTDIKAPIGREAAGEQLTAWDHLIAFISSMSID